MVTIKKTQVWTGVHKNQNSHAWTGAPTGSHDHEIQGRPGSEVMHKKKYNILGE